MNTITDIFKIVFVFVVFYVPTVAIFYQFYHEADNDYFGGVRQMMFTVYRLAIG